MKSYRSYRGYKIAWHGTTNEGHWMIYDHALRFVGSADRTELDDVIDELESEG